jgi:ATP-dependent Clp protease ATP-binding subunit ClpA
VTDRFDKFTERARKTLQLAQEEAQRFNHNYVGTEHILLGLVREGDGVAACVLQDLGIDLNKVRASVEFIIGRGDRVVMGLIGLTPRAKRVIELAVDEARRLNHHYIGTEHLLLGLVREGEGIAAGVLESLGLSLGKVRAQVIEVLKSSSDYTSSDTGENMELPIPTRSGYDEARALWRFMKRTTGFVQGEPEDLSDGVALLGTWMALELQVASLEYVHNSFLDALRAGLMSAVRHKRDYIAADNLLDGMLRKEDSAASRLLKQHDVELGGSVIIELESRPSRPEGEQVHALTPVALRAIFLAIEEARSAGMKATATHLLLGIMLEGENTAYAVLAREGITADEVRALIQADNADNSV